MGFDIVDAYENIKELREEFNYIGLRNEYIYEKLKQEGILDDKDFEKWLKERNKKSDNNEKN